MAGPPAPLLPRGLQPPAGSAPLQDGALAHASSPTPPAKSPGASPCPPRGRRRGPGARCGGGGQPGRCGGAGVPRQSASEREKLRMRRLAQALLRLRHYLPPALAPAGQSLTKVETLRLATRYIAHLSALLGLGEGRRRGAAPRHCPLCPQGLGCCQPPGPRPPPPAPRDAAPPGAAGWGSPLLAGTPPELRGVPETGSGVWVSPAYGPTVGTPPEAFGVPETASGAWGSLHSILAMGTPPEPHGSPGSISGSWTSPVPSLEPPRRCVSATGAGTVPSCFPEPAAPPESPGSGLTDTGTPGTPARGSQLPAHCQLSSPPGPPAALILPSCPPAWHWGGWS